MDYNMPGFPVLHHLPRSLLKLISLELVIPSNHLILCHPLLLLSSIFPSIRVFSNESALPIRWSKYWNFSFSIKPPNEYSGWEYSLEYFLNWKFRTDWLDLAVQGTLKSLLQHHSSKAAILGHSAFFMVQLSHPHMITGKTITLTRWTFVIKVMSLLFNMLSGLVIAFLPRSTHHSISWLQSPFAVILESKKIKSLSPLPFFSQSTRHEVMEPYAMTLAFWMLSFKSTFSLSSFTFKRLFSSSSLCCKGGVICVSEVMIFLLEILIPAYASFNLAFCMMYTS